MKKCLRCGLCCKDCKFLVGNKIKSCRIYKNRLGTIVKGNKVCVLRQDMEENFPNCPYNK